MPSMLRIALTRATRKMLVQRLQQAYAAHIPRLIRRIHALLELAEGASVTEVAGLLGIGEQTVRDWLHAFVQRGEASLAYRCPPGRPAKLSRCQRQELLAWILAGPEAAGYPTACWTAVLIADLLRERFRVRYHPRYIPHLLDQLGLSYQKAKFSAAGADDEAALVWLEETWPAIVRLAQERHALVFFGDEATFAQWGSLGYTWALKGIQPIVKTSGIRKAYRVFGVLDCFGGRFLYRGLEEAKFTSDTYQAFLAWLLTQVDCAIILIQDNAPYHTSAALRQFYAAHTDRLTVYQLPSYSPDLSPIEPLWKKIKKAATQLHYFPTFAHLVTEVTTTLHRYAGLPAELTAVAGEYRYLPHPAA
jgi:transposase